MGPGEIAGLASGGYVSIGLCAARYMYHHYTFEYDFDRTPVSLAQILVWPFSLLIFGLAGFLKAPTRSERKTQQLQEAERARERRAAHIRQMERDLGIAQPDPLPPPLPPSKPTAVLNIIRAAVGIPLAKPDHRCSLCIPGRPPANCPFWPGCQQ